VAQTGPVFGRDLVSPLQWLRRLVEATSTVRHWPATWYWRRRRRRSCPSALRSRTRRRNASARSARAGTITTVQYIIYKQSITVKPRFTYSPLYVFSIYVLFFQRIICNTYQNLDIRTSPNVLYFILRTWLNVRTSLNVLYFILRTLLNVLFQWRNKARDCIVTSICEYWSINLCPLSSFLMISILDQTSTSIWKGWVPVDILFWVFHLGFFGEDHQPSTPYYKQVYANNPNLDLSTFQFE
jgi:hypothetical protein